jgi:hypothetical protein
MSEMPQPVVLELAPLPREQMGPYFILGLEKDASHQAIQAQWELRVHHADAYKSGLSTEDFDWAKETLLDPVRRINADLASLNADTTERKVGRLLQEFGWGSTSLAIGWVPLEILPLRDSEGDEGGLSNLDTRREAISLPALEPSFAAIESVLLDETKVPEDPWDWHIEEPRV